jgi:hypothetical protein
MSAHLKGPCVRTSASGQQEAGSPHVGIRPPYGERRGLVVLGELTLRLGQGPADSRDRRGSALKVGWTPALPVLLYARGLPGLNHPMDSGMVRWARLKRLPEEMIQRLTARVKTQRLAAG